MKDKMEKVVKTTDGHTLFLFQTTRLGHDVMDRNDPKANEKIWVLHSTEGPALITPNNKKEYYFFGIYQGNNPEVLKDLKRHHTGLPPAKNPLFKTRL
jgi:hypothetical protein